MLYNVVGRRRAPYCVRLVFCVDDRPHQAVAIYTATLIVPPPCRPADMFTFWRNSAYPRFRRRLWLNLLTY